MSEERWTDRLFEQDCRRKGLDVELKLKRGAEPGEMCMAGKCPKDAVKVYQIGRVDGDGAIDIGVCADHDSEETAFQIYADDR